MKLSTIKNHSAGGVVVNREGKILMVNNRGKSWSFPKGHVDEGEDVLTAARREIREESGISHLNMVRELGTYERPAIHDPSELKTITLFLFTTPEEKLQPLDPHNPEARWVDKHDVGNLLTHPKDKEFFSRIQFDD